MPDFEAVDAGEDVDGVGGEDGDEGHVGVVEPAWRSVSETYNAFREWTTYLVRGDRPCMVEVLLVRRCWLYHSRHSKRRALVLRQMLGSRPCVAIGYRIGRHRDPEWLLIAETIWRTSMMRATTNSQSCSLLSRHSRAVPCYAESDGDVSQR